MLSPRRNATILIAKHKNLSAEIEGLIDQQQEISKQLSELYQRDKTLTQVNVGGVWFYLRFSEEGRLLECSPCA